MSCGVGIVDMIPLDYTWLVELRPFKLQMVDSS